MCGRFALFSDYETIRSKFGVLNSFEYKPRYNIAPTQKVPIIVSSAKGPIAMVATWGFDLHGRLVINCREETVQSKFGRLFEVGRCLVPADGFYEWNDKKVPFFIKGKTLLGFAGLYDGERFSIITTQATQKLSQIHHRMPVVIESAHYQDWLNAGALDASTDLEFHQVDKAVNSPKNDQPTIIAPLKTLDF